MTMDHNRLFTSGAQNQYLHRSPGVEGSDALTNSVPKRTGTLGFGGVSVSSPEEGKSVHSLSSELDKVGDFILDGRLQLEQRKIEQNMMVFAERGLTLITSHNLTAELACAQAKVEREHVLMAVEGFQNNLELSGFLNEALTEEHRQGIDKALGLASVTQNYYKMRKCMMQFCAKELDNRKKGVKKLKGQGKEIKKLGQNVDRVKIRSLADIAGHAVIRPTPKDIKKHKKELSAAEKKLEKHQKSVGEILRNINSVERTRRVNGSDVKVGLAKVNQKITDHLNQKKAAKNNTKQARSVAQKE